MNKIAISIILPVCVVVCVLIGACVAADCPQPQGPSAEGAKKMPEILKGVKRIVFYGDSLTDGSSYPDFVVNTLNGVYPDADFLVINSAIAGNTAANLKARFVEDVLDRKPDLVTFMIGTNDCIRNRPVADYKAELDGMVGELLAKGVKVMIILPSPLGDSEREEAFQAYLAAMRDVAARHKLIVADAHGEFIKRAKAGKEMLGPDGIHHGKDGFEGVARAVLDAIGQADVPVDTKVQPHPFALYEWQISEPVSWDGQGTPPYAKATGWKPYDRKAASEAQAWYDSPFVDRGGWMPNALGKAPAGSVVFGRAIYKADKAGKVEMQVGGTTPLKVWLNGKLVWKGRARHGVHPNADRFPVEVRKGDNEIIVYNTYVAFVGIRPLDE